MTTIRKPTLRKPGDSGALDFWFAQGTLIHGPDNGGIDIGPLIGEARTEASAANLVRTHNAMIRTQGALDEHLLNLAIASADERVEGEQNGASKWIHYIATEYTRLARLRAPESDR